MCAAGSTDATHTTLVEEHRLSEVIPSDHLLPIDYNLVRIIAAENALLVELK